MVAGGRSSRVCPVCGIGVSNALPHVIFGAKNFHLRRFSVEILPKIFKPFCMEMYVHYMNRLESSSAQAHVLFEPKISGSRRQAVEILPKIFKPFCRELYVRYMNWLESNAQAHVVFRAKNFGFA